jgi:hypothetical protein
MYTDLIELRNLWWKPFASLLLGVSLLSCASGQELSGSEEPVAPLETVSITTFLSKEKGDQFAAIKIDAVFEERDGCLYVGGDQAVWLFGTTVGRRPDSSTFEVRDARGRKLAETGTSVIWGGGQISAANAKSGNFADTLDSASNCKNRYDNFWVVGEIQSPIFEANN